MKGSLTVEAALVFPFCIVVIGIVCLLGIFLYDQTVLKMTGYECILQKSGQRDLEETTLQEELQKIAEDTGKDRVLSVDDLQTTVRVTSSKIMISYSGMQKILNLPMEVSVVYERKFPELTLRLIRKSREML